MIPLMLATVGATNAQEFPALDCVTRPYKTVDLASPVPGVLDKIYVGKSDFIQLDQVAASLEAGVEQATVVLAGARAAIESEVELNSVNLEFDQRRKERMAALYEKNSVSIELKEEAEREHGLSRWRVQQAEDLKAIRKLELLRAEEQLQQKTIRTPIAGFVLEQFKEAGEYVEDQPIMRIAQLDPLHVLAAVPIELHGKIRKGMRAKVYLDTSRDQPRDAEVSIIDRVADASDGSFGISLTLANPDYEILGGIRCQVKLESARGND